MQAAPNLSPQASSGHPCFDPQARRTSARVHLPVAPRCNLQCRYCNRQTDCLHESRPGVTSGVLTPSRAIEYLHAIVAKIPQTRVVGIAGPGDPMANPDETLDTLRRVRQAYPEMLLCLASNGLNLPPYLEDLASLGVSHVTVTVNAIDPEVGRTIYDWMRFGRRTHTGIAAAEFLWEQQKLSLQGLADRGITAKVNTLYLPGINDFHVGQVAQTVARFGASFHNLIPLYPVAGTPFGVLKEPSAETMRQARARCGLHLPQMTHCQRCRADAAGLLGEDHPDVAGLVAQRKAAGRRVAVASLEGVLVNLHLGQAPFFAVLEETEGRWSQVDVRRSPDFGGGDERWLALVQTLADCSAVFVSGAGARPLQILAEAGLEVLTVEGLIDELVPSWGRGDTLNGYLRREVHPCSAGCRGTGTGCG